MKKMNNKNRQIKKQRTANNLYMTGGGKSGLTSQTLPHSWRVFTIRASAKG
jgi:hypothetical protein